MKFIKNYYLYNIEHNYIFMKIFSLFTLVVITTAVLSCGKTENHEPTDDNIGKKSIKEIQAPKLVGERKWSVTYYINRPPETDTSYRLPDETFALTLSTLDTIGFKGYKLAYKNQTFTKDWIDTTRIIYYENYVNMHAIHTLHYFYEADSVVITIRDGGLSGYYYTRYVSTN